MSTTHSDAIDNDINLKRVIPHHRKNI